MSEPTGVAVGLIARIRKCVASGDYLRAYDLTDSAAGTPLGANEVAQITYLRILALARSGATDRAEAELTEWSVDDNDMSARLQEDRSALGARLAKDRALAPGTSDRALTALAASLYEDLYDLLGRPYACINAATLWLLAGDEPRARSLAAQALTRLDRSDSGDPLDQYWSAATAAEAALVLGDTAGFATLVTEAGPLASTDLGARATTRHQLTTLCAHLGLDADELLEPLANPAVLHYCGHRIAAPDSTRFEREVAPRISTEIAELSSGRGLAGAHGSLACGSDIMIAEALLATGVALHVVLPFDVAEFVEVSVRTGGDAWIDRFERCLAAADSVTVSSDSGYLGDDQLFSYASRIAMGEALNQARRIAAPSIQLAVWDGNDSDGAAGTAHDIRLWKNAGGPTTVIAATAQRSSSRAPAGTPPVSRPLTAVLFGDVQGISRLHDEELLRFIPAALGAAASAIEPFRESVVQRNTWGDAIFVAFTEVRSAARAALAIQHALQELDLAALGLPTDLSLRLAAHVGPTLRVFDPLRGSEGVFGRELTRAARIEPRTPPGAVYATRAFAALLALDPDADVATEYVGTITTAKDFETIPMFVLRPRHPRSSA